MAGNDKVSAQDVNPAGAPALTNENLAGYVLPDNKWDRAKLLAGDGLSNMGAGMVDAVKYDFSHPLETVAMLGGSAALGAGSKILLPESGWASWAAPAALGAYFIGSTAVGVWNAFDKGLNAKTSQQFDAAGKQLGDVGGSLVVNGIASGAAYGLGAYGGGKLLMSQRMDGFADMKANLWGRADNPLGLRGAVGSDGISTAGSVSIASRIKLDGDNAQLLMSNRTAPVEGVMKGLVDPNEPIDVTVMLKSKGSDLQMDRSIARMISGKQDWMTQSEFADKFGADPESLSQLHTFAANNGLTISETEMASGRTVLSGTVGDMSKAFNVRLNQFEHPSGVMFRAREGTISVPKELAPHIEGVFGLDDRAQARSYAIRLPVSQVESQGIVGPDGTVQPHANARSVSYYGNEVGKLYNFPQQLTGKGQGIAFPELGGGFSPEDNAAYFAEAGTRNPDVAVVTVDGAKNAPDGAQGASGEVHLDSQVAGSVAPDAKQM
ncbi:MAG: protease pro-enzyme activation domain-containing protein, partial [Terriglobales bacterium]